jgi:Ca-activated chloride channel family protein
MVKFYNPAYSWFLLLWLGVSIALIYYRYQRRQNLDELVQIDLLPRLLDDYRPGYRKLRIILGNASLLLLIIALIGPQVGQKLVEVKRRGQDIVLVLDTSNSMRAQDIKPSRIERAKFECSRFIDQLQGDRVGVVAFAGTAFLQCPLTLDYSAAKLFLDAVDCGVIGTQGTALGDAVNTALQAFKADDKTHKIIIILSDGEDHEGGLEEIIDQARAKDALIYCIGVGSYSGAPIPMTGPGGTIDFKRDRSGRVVTTSLNEQALQAIALGTGGKYFNLMVENNAFEKIYQDVLGLEKKTLSSHEYADFELRYQGLALMGLICFLAAILIPEKLPKRKLKVE